MTVVHRTIEVPVEPERAFDYVADFSTTAEWDPGVVAAARLDDDPIGVGTRFSVTSAFGDRQLPLVYEITTYERPARVVLIGTGRMFRGEDEIAFTPTSTGTRIDYRADLTLTGLARLAQPFMRGRFEQLADRAMAGLELVLSR
jgi:carbon monoxide dehydrogenase subunit G